MRRRRTTAGAGAAAHLNVTPMIDVVMVLIIFYLLVGQLASDRRSELALPRSASGDPRPPATAIVNVSRADGGLRVDVDGRPAGIDALARRVAGARVVHLRADSALAYDALRPVLDALGRAGVRSVRIATERAAGAGAP